MIGPCYSKNVVTEHHMTLNLIIDASKPIDISVPTRFHNLVADMFVDVPGMTVNGISTVVPQNQTLAANSADQDIVRTAKNLERQFNSNHSVEVAFVPPVDSRQAQLLHDSVQGAGFEPLSPAIGSHTAAVAASRLPSFSKSTGNGFSLS